MPKKKSKKPEGPKKKKVSYIYRKRGKKAISENLLNVLKPTESDVMRLLAAQVHIGRTKAHVNMKRYVWKRRDDGVHIINLEKTWAKLMLAARMLVTVNDPSDICVMSTRTFGQRGAIKFAHYTGATAIVGKWVPGSFTNPRNARAFKEPRLLLVDDPNTCFAALRETSYVGIPTIAFTGVDCNLRFVDCAIPINNRGKYSIGLMFYLLAREYKRMKGEIERNLEWEESVDLFFYRTQDEVIKLQEKEKQKTKEDNDDDNQHIYDQENMGDYERKEQELQQQDNQNDEQELGWEAEPPEEFDENEDDWAQDNQDNINIETW